MLGWVAVAVLFGWWLWPLAHGLALALVERRRERRAKQRRRLELRPPAARRPEPARRALHVLRGGTPPSRPP